MYKDKIKFQTQSILVPRKNYKNVIEAAKHVEEMGFKPDVKKPHITDRFYRFRQREPQKRAEYKTEDISKQNGLYRGDKAVLMSIPKEKHILGRDPATWTPKPMKLGNPYAIPLKK